MNSDSISSGLEELFSNHFVTLKRGRKASWDVLIIKDIFAFSEALLERERMAVVAAQTDDFISKLETYPIFDQQLVLGGLIYRYLMKPTNATKVNISLRNFSQQDKQLGDLTITAQLRTTNRSSDGTP